MSGDEQLRHCQKCDTYVHNLTGMTDAEIMELRKENGGKLCGSFRMGPSLAKPLALGSGIASLALVACTKSEPPLVGMLPPIEYGKGSHDEDVEDKNQAKPPPPIMLGGVIVAPDTSDE